MGNFSVLKDLPEMYRHCKETEDKDMTPLDFITDHLINIDGLFDKHEHGDEQKPHQPTPTQYQGQTIVIAIICFSFSLEPFSPVKARPSTPSISYILSDYISGIFHPPIA